MKSISQIPKRIVQYDEMVTATNIIIMLLLILWLISVKPWVRVCNHQ